MRQFLLASMLSLAALSQLNGCASPYSEVPIASNFPTSKQLKLQSAHHWQVIADDLAQKLVHDLPINHPIFIEPSNPHTAFSDALTNQLMTSLSNKGITVLKEASDQYYLIDINIQLLKFAADRRQIAELTTASGLATGVWSVDKTRANIWTASQRDGIHDDRSALNDFYWHGSEFASGPTPQHELIITIGIGNETQYSTRKTASYYITDADLPLYQAEKGLPTRTIRVTGGY